MIIGLDTSIVSYRERKGTFQKATSSALRLFRPLFRDADSGNSLDSLPPVDIVRSKSHADRGITSRQQAVFTYPMAEVAKRLTFAPLFFKIAEQRSERRHDFFGWHKVLVDEI